LSFILTFPHRTIPYSQSATIPHIKVLPWIHCFPSSTHVHKPHTLPRSPILYLCASGWSTQIFHLKEYPHTHDHSSMTSPTFSTNAGLVKTAHHNERPSVKLKIPSGKSNVLNSAVVGAAGQSLYTISSSSKRTTFVACKDNVEIATVNWNCPVPRMVFRRKKMKCKDWLPLAGPGTESV